MENDGQDRESLAWTWVEFGRRVRDLRKSKGLTQSALALQLGDLGVEMHQTTIAKIENGTRATVMHEVWAFAQVFGVDYGLLMPAPPDTNAYDAQAAEQMRVYAAAKAEIEQQRVRVRHAKDRWAFERGKLVVGERQLHELATQLPPSIREQLDKETN